METWSLFANNIAVNCYEQRTFYNLILLNMKSLRHLFKDQNLSWGNQLFKLLRFIVARMPSGWCRWQTYTQSQRYHSLACTLGHRVVLYMWPCVAGCNMIIDIRCTCQRVCMQGKVTVMEWPTWLPYSCFSYLCRKPTEAWSKDSILFEKTRKGNDVHGVTSVMDRHTPNKFLYWWSWR